MITREEVMRSSFQKKRLRDIVDFLDHKRRPITSSDRVSGIYPYYGANGIQDYVDGYLFDEELVLLAEDGGHFDDPDRGIAYKINGKSWVNNHAHVLKARLAVDQNYLFRVLQNYDVRSYITGTTRGKLTKGSACDIQIPLPPLPEQRRIAEILDKAEALRAKRRAALTKLDTLARSLFLEMFGDPASNPKNWPLSKFSDIGKLDRGISKHRPRNAPELLGGPYPLVQTGDVANSDGYIRGFNSTYSEAGLRQSRIWPAGTLCITIAANIAKTGILKFDACFPDSVVGFSSNHLSTVEFVRVWLGFLQKMLEETAPESAQKNINLEILRNLDVPLPPLPLQQIFARRIETLEALKERHRASLTKLDVLFASLQHRAFRGEL